MINMTSRKISKTLKQKLGQVYIQETQPIENLVAKRRFLYRKGFGYAQVFPIGMAKCRELVPFSTFCYKAKGKSYVSVIYIRKDKYLALKAQKHQGGNKNVHKSENYKTCDCKNQRSFASGRVCGVIFYQD